MELPIGELFFSGVKLMFFGMGIVFLFLALLVWVIGFSSRLIQRYSPDATSNPSLQAPAHEDDSDAEIVAAISAALHLHQNQ